MGPGAAFAFAPADPGAFGWTPFPFVGGPVGVELFDVIGPDGGLCNVNISLGRSIFGRGLFAIADVGV